MSRPDLDAIEKVCTDCCPESIGELIAYIRELETLVEDLQYNMKSAVESFDREIDPNDATETLAQLKTGLGIERYYHYKRIEELEVALKPFAEAAERYFDEDRIVDRYNLFDDTEDLTAVLLAAASTMRGRRE